MVVRLRFYRQSSHMWLSGFGRPGLGLRFMNHESRTGVVYKGLELRYRRY